ncbi:MAG: prepilin-type N-terminal cleavage/methylation domain-containing protein [Desulfuromonadaceae bacterium]|nr:prepilin-type N-terminal cleavage/methylation domain-containing protein [Desulfuromonadaceae bacterium]
MKMNKKGFSLIELMVSMAILAIGLLGLAGLQGTAINGNHHGNMISQATVLAQDTIEQIRNTDYDDIDTATNADLPASTTVDNFNRAILIEDVTSLTGLKRVTVTVSWRKLKQHRVVLRTIVSDEG